MIIESFPGRSSHFVGCIKAGEKVSLVGFDLDNPQRAGDCFDVITFDPTMPNSTIDFESLQEFTGKLVVLSIFESDVTKQDTRKRKPQNMFVSHSHVVQNQEGELTHIVDSKDILK